MERSTLTRTAFILLALGIATTSKYIDLHGPACVCKRVCTTCFSISVCCNENWVLCCVSLSLDCVLRTLGSLHAHFCLCILVSRHLACKACNSLVIARVAGSADR